MVNLRGWQWITTLPELHIIFRKSRHLKQERELWENSWLRIIFHLPPFISPDVQFAGCNSTGEGSQGQIRGTDEHSGSSWRRRHFLNLEKNGLQWLKTDLAGTCWEVTTHRTYNANTFIFYLSSVTRNNTYQSPFVIVILVPVVSVV